MYMYILQAYSAVTAAAGTTAHQLSEPSAVKPLLSSAHNGYRSLR